MKNRVAKTAVIFISVIVAIIAGVGLWLSQTPPTSRSSYAQLSQSMPFPTDIATRDDGQRHQTIVIKETDGDLLWAVIVGNRVASPLRRLNLPERCCDIALSPDGKTLAYTRYGQPRQRCQRFIELLDMASGQTRRLTAIESDNSYGPSWSHDGQYLAIKTWNVNIGFWDIGIVGVDNGDFRIVSQARLSMGYFGPAVWGPSETSIYCGDLDKLRELDLRGVVPIRSFILRALVPKGMFSSAWSMDLSHDGRTLLFATELPDKEVRWHMGGRGAIYALDLSTGSAHPVSPHDISARNPAWLDGDCFLFLGIHLTRKNRAAINRGEYVSSNLYLCHLKSKKSSVLHEKVWEFSVSAAPREKLKKN